MECELHLPQFDYSKCHKPFVQLLDKLLLLQWNVCIADLHYWCSCSSILYLNLTGETWTAYTSNLKIFAYYNVHLFNIWHHVFYWNSSKEHWSVIYVCIQDGHYFAAHYWNLENYYELFVFVFLKVMRFVILFTRLFSLLQFGMICFVTHKIEKLLSSL